MKRILSIIVTSIIVVVLFVGLKYFTFNQVLPKANYGMRAICETSGISDLYIGSSMFRQGIYARDLDANAYLLAYNSNKPCHEAMQVKHLLDNGASFNRLIVDMYPYSMVRDAELSDARMIMDGDLRFTLELFSFLPKPRSLTTLYDMIVLQNNEFFLTLPVSFKLLNARNNRGSNTSIVHGKTDRELNTLTTRSDEVTIEMNETQIAGLNEIISICEEQHIEVVFLETPKYKSVNEDPVYRELMTTYAKFLSEKQIPMVLYEKTSAVVSDKIDESLVRSYRFDDGQALYYTDPFHISYEGRQQFTDALKGVL